MRRQSRLGGLFILVLVGLIVPLLATAPAQAASAIVGASGAPFGVSQGDSFSVNKDAGLAAQLRAGTGGGNSTNAHCLEPGYVQVFETAGGGHLHTSFPGLTITAQTFSILLHRGIVVPGTRAIWSYRWDSTGFDYYTSFANENCLIQEERNALSAQNFPINNPVSVSVCFVSWETNQVLCGWVGTVNRIS